MHSVCTETVHQLHVVSRQTVHHFTKYLWTQFITWTNKKVLSFIKDLQLNECLWNIKSEQYRDRKAKSDAIEHLSSKYEISISEVEKKIANLRCQFRREHKKSSNINKSGSYPRATWFGYKPLLFLLQHVEVCVLTQMTLLFKN